MYRLFNTSSTLTMALAASAIPSINAAASPADAAFQVEGFDITAGSIITMTISVLVIIQGLAQVIIPTATLKLYKSPTGIMNTHLFTVMGTSSLSMAIATICLLLSMDYTTSIGYALLPWLIVPATNIMTRKHTKVHYPISNDLFPVIVGGLLCFSCLTGYSYADRGAAAFGCMMLLNGTTLITVPNMHVRAWGSEHFHLTIEKEPILPTSLRALGFSLLSLGTFITVAYFDIPVVQAFAYAWMWILMMILLPVFSKEVKGGLNGRHMMWFVPCVLVLGSTIFSWS